MKKRDKRETHLLILDMVMLVLLLLNLGLIIFDWIFLSITVQKVLSAYLPNFFAVYRDRIHADFAMIDLGFVAIFLIEFFLRWGIAIRRRTYYKWFFYPFIHWYDLIGCIPVGSLRFLRLLRIIGIIIRLQRLQIIDITRTYLYGQFNKYVNVVVEEISDRVVVNVIKDVQAEIRDGSPVTDRIIQEVVLPQKESIVLWLSHRLQHIASNAHAAYKEDFREYLHLRVKNAVENNPEIATIGMIPVVGKVISGNLEKAISDITFNTISGLIEDLGSSKNQAIVEEVADITIDALMMEEADQRIDKIVNEALVQALELVKEQVQIQQWKLREMREKEEGSS